MCYHNLKQLKLNKIQGRDFANVIKKNPIHDCYTKYFLFYIPFSSFIIAKHGGKPQALKVYCSQMPALTLYPLLME